VIASRPSVWLGSGERLSVPLKMTARRSSYVPGAASAWPSMKVWMEAGIGMDAPVLGGAGTLRERCENLYL
jgi:hypothetical protein